MTQVLANKHPDNVEPYFYVWCDPTGTNIAGDNGELQGATISTTTWTFQTGLTKDSENEAAVTVGGISYAINTVATVWVSGGTDGTSYTVSCKITTSDSRTLTRSFIIPVTSTAE